MNGEQVNIHHFFSLRCKGTVNASRAVFLHNLLRRFSLQWVFV